MKINAAHRCVILFIILPFFIAPPFQAGSGEFVHAADSSVVADTLKRWRTLAEQGDAESQFNLGSMYFNGHGVPQSDVHAHMWANLASAAGYQKAAKFRDILAELMTPAQITEAQQLAREWKSKK